MRSKTVSILLMSLLVLGCSKKKVTDVECGSFDGNYHDSPVAVNNYGNGNVFNKNNESNNKVIKPESSVHEEGDDDSQDKSFTESNATDAVFTNFANNSYTHCKITKYEVNDSTCSQISPSDGKSSMLDGPMGAVQNKDYVYIVNYKNDSYTKCRVQKGVIDSKTCSIVIPKDAKRSLLDGPTGIVLDRSFVYITNSKGNSYTQCQVKNNLIEPSTCTTVTPEDKSKKILSAPNGISIYKDSAYIMNSDSSNYTVCKLNSKGIDSSTCSSTDLKDSKANLLKTPRSIGFYRDYAYIVNGRDNSYTKCSLNAKGLDPRTCSTIKLKGSETYQVESRECMLPGQDPREILLSPRTISFLNDVAYITNLDSSYTKCKVNKDGIMANTCTNMHPKDVKKSSLSGPYSLIFFTK